ncbi:MAG: hypothetical protein CMQ24_19440 [Gammaproteobacteria bacterium]|nr:hypothetical protein [Gammaproteobacteria bacterium]
MKNRASGVAQTASWLALAFLACCAIASSASGATTPTAVGGILDLRDWNFDKDGPVPLAGEVEFFWGSHLASREVPLATADGGLDYTTVPASWNEHVHLGEMVGSYGIATYRVNALVPERSPVALKVPELGTAYRLLIDGTAALEIGQPGPVKEKTIPRYAPGFLQFTPGQLRVELLFQVSKYHHRLGGLWLPIQIGTPAQLQEEREKAVALDVALFGCVLVRGLYNLVLFVVRRENKSNLYLGVLLHFDRRSSGSGWRAIRDARHA